jgi:hypothetical protein
MVVKFEVFTLFRIVESYSSSIGTMQAKWLTVVHQSEFDYDGFA